MKQRIIYWMCGIFAVTSCSHRSVMTGNDRDKHGCIGSAGYVWSAVKKDCVRLWEVGQRIDIDKESSAFIIFSEDSTLVEVFQPNDHKPFLLKRTKNGMWESKKGRVVFRNGNFKIEKL